MSHNAEVAAFIDMTLDHAVREAAIYSSGMASHEISAANGLALCVFNYVAKTTRSVDEAEKAEADFRRRVALLSEPHGPMQ
ncbi:MAG: hypothetical protein R3D70_12185 [Rhizobiaceae bacterium]